MTIHLALGWFFSPYFKERFGSIAGLYRAYFAGGLYIGLIVALLIVITAHAFIYYQNYRAGEVKRSALREQLAEAARAIDESGLVKSEPNYAGPGRG